MWAKNTGIHQHPEWYHGLTASSSTEDFHRYVSQLNLCSSRQGAPCAAHICDSPCYQTTPACSVDVTLGSDHSDSYWCGDRGFGASLDACTPDGNGGANLITTGRVDPGEVCPSMSGSLSVRHFPNPFCTGSSDGGSTALMDGMCLSGCCNQDASRCDLRCQASVSPTTCHHVSPDSDCASQLRWAMTEGVTNHPHWYTGLTARSSLSDFQRYLSVLPFCSENGHTPPCYGASEPCPTPCPSTTTTTTRMTSSYGWGTDSYGW